MAKRLVWAEVVALGQNVRAAEVGDNVLFSPEDRYEVEVQGPTTSCCASATSTPLPPPASRPRPACTSESDSDAASRPVSCRTCPSTPVPSNSRPVTFDSDGLVAAIAQDVERVRC